MGKHWQAYIRLTKCAEHIPVDVPNKRSCMTYLMEWINSVDPTVLAVHLAVVCQDEQDKNINFENPFAYLVLICPVKAKLAKKGKVTFQAGILGSEASTASGLGGKAKKPGCALIPQTQRFCETPEGKEGCKVGNSCRNPPDSYFFCSCGAFFTGNTISVPLGCIFLFSGIYFLDPKNRPCQDS